MKKVQGTWVKVCSESIGKKYGGDQTFQEVMVGWMDYYYDE
jgi:hypothetical protein